MSLISAIVERFLVVPGLGLNDRWRASPPVGIRAAHSTRHHRAAAANATNEAAVTITSAIQIRLLPQNVSAIRRAA